MNRDRRITLSIAAGALALIAATAIFAPAVDDDSGLPSVESASGAGAKAAFLMLQRAGYRVQRSTASVLQAASLDAPHTTLVLANPNGTTSRQEQTALADFLKRGGRVLATGFSGVDILPGYYWNDQTAAELCFTEPRGASSLAAAGRLKLYPTILAKEDLVETEVAQHCKNGAAVITYPVGPGTAVWWATPAPLTNRGLHEDENLRLLLASVGDRSRTIVFNESNLDQTMPSIADTTKGLPLRALFVQLLLVAVLLVLSFGRRHGPLRSLMSTPRTSPLEFAYSMGSLYSRAAAGEAAVQEARQRLLPVIEHQCGIAPEVVREGGEAIASALTERLGYNNPALPGLLSRTAADGRVPSAAALQTVLEMNAIGKELRRAARGTAAVRSKETVIV